MAWLITWGPGIIALSGLISVVGGLYLSFRKDRNDSSAAVRAAQAQEQDLKAQIDARIDTRVQAELERQDGEIKALRGEVDDLKKANTRTNRENSAIKTAVRQWFYALRFWDREGRHGAMPMPADDDMLLLELDPGDSTIPGSALTALRDPQA